MIPLFFKRIVVEQQATRWNELVAVPNKMLLPTGRLVLDLRRLWKRLNLKVVAVKTVFHWTP